MGSKHSKDDLLAAAVTAAYDGGLSQLSFGRVAKQLGIHDRTVVYYFPTKAQLVTEVLTSLGVELGGRLADVVTDGVADHRELLRSAWPVLADERADPFFALYFEAAGLAAAGSSPYDVVLPALVAAWVDWAEARMSATTPDPRGEAHAAIGVIDGLLLLRRLAGADAADRAAHLVWGG